MCHLSTIRIYVIKYIYAWKGKGGMDVMGWDGWMEGCEAKRAVGRMEVCLEEEREKVPFLQLTESQTARHMAVLVDGQR